MRVILVGAAGRMGACMRRAIEDGGDSIAAAVDIVPLKLSCPCYQDISEAREDADVILDFSHAGQTKALVSYALSRKMPLVIATTGQSAQDVKLIKDAAKQIPIFFCSNMSFGVSLFASLVGRVAQAFPYADVEIVEAHHAAKADAPSGTALMLANTVIRARGEGNIVTAPRGRRRAGDVGISSLRLGERAGVHEVMFDTGLQMITLRHEAFGRELFAKGAVNAMRFLMDKPAGLYGVDDLHKK